MCVGGGGIGGEKYLRLVRPRGGPSIYQGEGPKRTGDAQSGRGILDFIIVRLWIVANYTYKRALEAKLCFVIQIAVIIIIVI